MIERLREVRPSTKMWATILGGVALYDVLSPEGETLSENCHWNIEQGGLRRLAICSLIGATAFHLLDGFRRVGLPDPFGVTLSAIKHNRHEAS